jgi:signal transduction histidine kinase
MSDHAAAYALLALAVHELRSPASVIGGAIRLLAAGRAGSLAPDQRRLVDRVSRASELLDGLLAEASEICRLEAGEAAFNRRPLSLDPILDRVVAAFRSPGDVSLVAERCGSSATRLVLADPTRLERAFAAMLDLVARDARGRSTLVAAVAPAAGGTALEVRMYQAREDAAADAAPDLPALAPLGDDRPGCGLAVALARRIIEAEGGRVRASPVGAPAAVVEIVLPVHA